MLSVQMRQTTTAKTATVSPIAKEALDRIGQLYPVEQKIDGSPPTGDGSSASSDPSVTPCHPSSRGHAG